MKSDARNHNAALLGDMLEQLMREALRKQWFCHLQLVCLVQISFFVAD